MIFVEFLSSALVVAAIAAMAYNKRMLGFCLNVFSAIGWSAIAVHSQLYGLLMLQAFIAGLALIGLYRIRKGS